MHRETPSPSEKSVRNGNAGSLPSWTSLGSCGDAAAWTSWASLADVDDGGAAAVDRDDDGGAAAADRENFGCPASADHEDDEQSGDGLSGDGYGPVGNRVIPRRLGAEPAEDVSESRRSHGDAGERERRQAGDGVGSLPTGVPLGGDPATESDPAKPLRGEAARMRVAYPLPGIRGDGFARPETDPTTPNTTRNHVEQVRLDSPAGPAARYEQSDENEPASALDEPSANENEASVSDPPYSSEEPASHEGDEALSELPAPAAHTSAEPTAAAHPSAAPTAAAHPSAAPTAGAPIAPAAPTPTPVAAPDARPATPPAPIALSANAREASETANLSERSLPPDQEHGGHASASPSDWPAGASDADGGWFPDPAVMAELDALANADGTAGDLHESGEAWGDFSQLMQGGGQASDSGGEDVRGDGPEGFSALDLRDRVVIMLLFKQVVRIADVHKVYKRWRKQGGAKARDPLWRVLANDPAFDRETIFAEAAQVYAFKQAEFERSDAVAFIRRHCDTFPEEACDQMRRLRVLPIRQEVHATKKERRTIFISHDPSRLEVNRLMRELRLDSFELQYSPESEVDALIQEAFPKRNEYLDRVSQEDFAYDLGTSYDASMSIIDEDALEAEISRSSLINLFEASLIEAVRQGASDIHIFPNARKQIEIHFRINGELGCWHREERVHPEAMLAVVKDNTLNVDRFERDAAQDGFIQRKVDDTIIRYRVSVLPVANANQEIRSESIVIRVLDDRKVITDLGRLGLLSAARSKFEWAIRQPHGMVILTGPTGSGKTTTLFAALHQVVTPKVNVLTVEDPVEYVIPGVRQIKLSHKLNVEQALRSILRHDPDVVMVGEMRDRETADLAIKLANTGHLTFSTLHTNDAPSAVSRLYKMGVEPFLIAYAINLIVAQRLMRTLCPQCKRPATSVDHEMLRRLGFTAEEIAEMRLFDDGGKPDCRSCGGTGYKGRRAITETMAFTPEIRRAIILARDMIDEDALRKLAIEDGMLTLRASAREIVKQGETSIAELIRATAGEH